MTPFVLVTGNRDKVTEAERILGRRLESIDLDLPEMQGLDLLTILRAKGEEAWRRLGRPLAVEETGLDLDALNGFPGPLVRWMLEAVGADGIARTAHALGDPRARAHCAVLYRDAPGAVLGEGRRARHPGPPPAGHHRLRLGPRLPARRPVPHLRRAPPRGQRRQRPPWQGLAGAHAALERERPEPVGPS